MHSIAAAVNQTPITVAWYGDDDTVAEFSYRLIDADHIELIATLHQTDKASGRTYAFTLADKIVEAEYAEDEACDLEYEARNALHDLGVNGWATGRFSESVAAALDRAAVASSAPALAAE
jgi:hypothetical protein